MKNVTFEPVSKDIKKEELGGGGRGVASGSYKWKKIILGAKEGKSEER